MIINAKTILGLPVETKSGEKLGKVSDFDIDIESHIIKSYFVESGFLSSKKLIISRNQIVSINKEKMIVEDGAVKEEKKVETQYFASKKEPALSSTITTD